MPQGKAPKDVPERNQRCCLRGKPHVTGVLDKYDPVTNWATVIWDEDGAGPKVVHRFELVRETKDASDAT